MTRLKRRDCAGVRRAREAAGLTQMDLAAKAGVSVVSIVLAEKMRQATPAMAERLAAALGVPVEQLVSEENG